MLADDVLDGVDIVTGEDSREDHEGRIHSVEDVHNPKAQSRSSYRKIKHKFQEENKVKNAPEEDGKEPAAKNIHTM